MKNEIKIRLIHTGSVYVSKGVPYGNTSMIKASGFFESKSSFSWLPVSVYLVEHPDGLALFDTGWSREIAPNGGTDLKAQSKQMGKFLTKKRYASREAYVSKIVIPQPRRCIYILALLSCCP